MKSRAILVLVLLCAVVLTLPTTALCTTIYVTTTGSDTNDGLSWSTAKQTVQEGINTAVSGDQVWVAAGTYVERITLKAGVAVYGGFAGAEASLAERVSFPRTSPDSCETVLDGNQAGPVVSSGSGISATARIDGFTFRNGGIECLSSSPTMAWNTITSTSYIRLEGSSPQILNNVFTDIQNTGHAAISFYNSGSPHITGNTFRGNWRVMDCGYGVSPTIADNTMFSNGDIISGYSSSSYVIRNNRIYGNNGIISLGYSNATITNNAIIGTRIALSGMSGVVANNVISGTDSGISCNACTGVSIRNNTITGNYEAGILCGYFDSSHTNNVEVSNNIIAFNASGIYWHGAAAPTVIRTNCLYNPGGPEYCQDGSPVPSITGTGDLLEDPKLVNAAYAKVHILPDSPCINRGTDADVLPGWVDMDGQTRIIGSQVDIGADESNGTSWDTSPRVAYVSTTGDDTDGSSWAHAKRSVQAAINSIAGEGGEVWVASGTYSENIVLHPNVHLYGGFAGVENVRSDRDCKAYETILDGGGLDSVVKILHGYYVSVIDGFTIRNGHSPTYGGGVYMQCSAMVSNNRITGNTSTYYGGGIHSWRDGTIFGNIITLNTATGPWHGGGISCRERTAVLNNVIDLNTAGYKGGGIWLEQHFGPISNNTITRNIGLGGIYIESTAQSVISNNIIVRNNGGVCSDGSGVPFTIKNNDVWENGYYNYNGITDRTNTDGNITADPLFVNADKYSPVEKSDYHLAVFPAVSPCIDAGDPSQDYTGESDIDGESRVVGSNVDIGADEWEWSLAINNDALSTDTTAVTLSLGTNRNLTDISSVRFRNEGGSWSDWMPWSTIVSWTLTDGEELKKVYGQLQYSAGDTSRIVSDGICFSTEQTPPTGSITINNGAEYMRFPGAEITISISASDSESGIGGMRFGVDNTDWSNIGWTSFSSTVSTNVPVGDGVKTAKVQVRDRAGNIATFTDTIILDSTDPTGTISIDGGAAYTNSRSVILDLSAIDANGVASMRFSDSFSSPWSLIWSEWEDYATTKSWNLTSGSGTKTVYVQFVDKAGNWSRNYSDTITVDTTPPTVAITSPTSSGTYTTTSQLLSIGGTAADSSAGISSVAWSSNRGGVGTCTGTTSWSASGITLQPGQNIITVTATDNAANNTTTTLTVTYNPPPAALLSSSPADQKSLWRSAKNIIRLTFDGDITVPSAGQVTICEMLAGGTYGPDLSSGFTFTVENDGAGYPRILRIRENASSLTHRKWYAVRNTGSWMDVGSFTVQYVVQVGDSSNDGRVLNQDVSIIRTGIPTSAAADDDRRDINGDGKIINGDASIANSRIPSNTVTKPTGH